MLFEVWDKLKTETAGRGWLEVWRRIWEEWEVEYAGLLDRAVDALDLNKPDHAQLYLHTERTLVHLAIEVGEMQQAFYGELRWDQFARLFEETIKDRDSDPLLLEVWNALKIEAAGKGWLEVWRRIWEEEYAGEVVAGAEELLRNSARQA